MDCWTSWYCVDPGLLMRRKPDCRLAGPGRNLVVVDRSCHCNPDLPTRSCRGSPSAFDSWRKLFYLRIQLVGPSAIRNLLTEAVEIAFLPLKRIEVVWKNMWCRDNNRWLHLKYIAFVCNLHERDGVNEERQNILESTMGAAVAKATRARKTINLANIGRDGYGYDDKNCWS